MVKDILRCLEKMLSEGYPSIFRCFGGSYIDSFGNHSGYLRFGTKPEGVVGKVSSEMLISKTPYSVSVIGGEGHEILRTLNQSGIIVNCMSGVGVYSYSLKVVAYYGASGLVSCIEFILDSYQLTPDCIPDSVIRRVTNTYSGFMVNAYRLGVRGIVRVAFIDNGVVEVLVNNLRAVYDLNTTRIEGNVVVPFRDVRVLSAGLANIDFPVLVLSSNSDNCGNVAYTRISPCAFEIKFM